jgi:hypothetical protein
MSMKLPKPTFWQDQGFAEQPEELTASGGEVVYRAYGGASRVLGNCFFTPAIGASPIGYWTAELLEVELNAALWSNDFEGITKFQMIKGTKYRIGPIAHDDYVGLDNGRRFYQRAFFTPSGIFKQVTFILGENRDLSACVMQLGSSFSISAGRYAREASKRAKKYRQ